MQNRSAAPRFRRTSVVSKSFFFAFAPESSNIAIHATIQRWKQRARELKRDVYALYLAGRDPRVPWHAKLLVAVVVGYAFSPIDLIPDFIPVLGLLDDLVLVPLGIALAVRLIPPEVLADCRAEAAERAERPQNWIAAGFVLVLWLLLAGIGVVLLRRWL